MTSDTSKTTLQERYERLKTLSLSLDLARGKPAAEQLQLSHDLDGILDGDFVSSDGTDTRNYGLPRGIEEMRDVGSLLMDLPSSQVMAHGNSSLQLMYIVLDYALNYGIAGRPFRDFGPSKALCPVPGYDRHFAMTEALGIEMDTVDMDERGPLMDDVEEKILTDPSIRFLWCVPKYSNPTGCVYSPETVDRIARLPAIRQRPEENPLYVFWDNAYAVHDFEDPPAELDSIWERAGAHGTKDRIVLFGSTSKITFAGGGVSFLGGSDAVLDSIESRMLFMVIGTDKVNQLRHARFFSRCSLQEHMAKHAAILKPKFDAVQRGLERELGNTGLASWTQPRGGYFVSVDLKPGLASRVVTLAEEVGLKLTPAGSTYPYKHDPLDQNLRLAPTFAAAEEVESAIEVFGVCVKLAAEEQASQS